jgi:hypothetical protein
LRLFGTKVGDYLGLLNQIREIGELSGVRLLSVMCCKGCRIWRFSLKEWIEIVHFQRSKIVNQACYVYMTSSHFFYLQIER